MLISGIVTIANLVLSGVIGVKLLRRAIGRESGPEMWLGLYFLCMATIASSLSILVYSSVAGAGLSLSEAAISQILPVYTIFAGVGSVGAYVFVWRTFRAKDRWAARLVAIGVLAAVGGFVGEALTEGFHVVVFPGPAYWVSRLSQLVPLLWACIESFRYWGQLRRRMRLGLAEPIVANRFLLWGCWALAASINASSDLVARLAYVAISGQTTEVLLEPVRPVIVVTIAVTSVVGVVAATTLLLTFFPTENYCRWVTSRARAGGA